MVNAEELKNGCLKIVDVDRVLGHVEAQLVRLAQGKTRLDAPASQPHGEGLWMVIAAIAALEGGAYLDHGSGCAFRCGGRWCVVTGSGRIGRQ